MHLLFEKVKSEGIYGHLPSVILNDQILKPLLSLDVSKPSDQKKIDFFKNGPEILSQLNSQKSDLVKADHRGRYF